MRIFPLLILALGLVSVAVVAGETDMLEQHKKVLLEEFTGAKILEIEREKEDGQWVWEYELEFEGEVYELVLTEAGEVLRKELD